VHFTAPLDGLAEICVAYSPCRRVDVIILPGAMLVADDAASILVQTGPLVYRQSV